VSKENGGQLMTTPKKPKEKKPPYSPTEKEIQEMIMFISTQPITHGKISFDLVIHDGKCTRMITKTENSIQTDRED